MDRLETLPLSDSEAAARKDKTNFQQVLSVSPPTLIDAISQPTATLPLADKSAGFLRNSRRRFAFKTLQD